MSQNTLHHSGISQIIGRIMDEAKVLADDVLDRVMDLEHDLRNALSRFLEDREPADPDRETKTTSPDSEELTRLQGELAGLQEKINRFAGAPEHR